MTYNVGSAANLPLGPRQIGQIADTIIDHRVDIAGFNEVELGTAWHDGRDHVAELLVALADRGYPMHVHRWASTGLQKGWQFQALLSRLPMEQMGYDVVERAVHNRWCMGWVRLRVAENTLIQACGTHIWPVGESAADLRRHIGGPAAFDGPCTVMGDFNLTPESGLYPIIADAGFRNSCEIANGAPCPSVQGTAGIAGPLPLTAQIDYIFVNPRVEMLRSYVGHFSMSDHWPVFAEVRVKADGRITPPSLPDDSIERRDAGAEREAVMKSYRAGRYTDAAAACDAWERACRERDNAGFAAYTKACLTMLAGEAAMPGFARVIEGYPDTEWAARSFHQQAFLHERERHWSDAEAAFVRYLDGYYAVIHTDVKAPAARLTAEEIARCRRNAGGTDDANRVLEDLAAAEPTSPRARAAAYWLARRTHDAGDEQRAVRFMRQADPEPRGMWPDEAKQCADIWLAAGEIGKADAFHQRYLAAFDNHLHRRVRSARWEKRTHPERFAVEVPRLKGINIDGNLSDWPATPTAVLEGEAHVYRADPLAAHDDLSARLWLGHDGTQLLLGVVVADGMQFCPFEAGDIFKGDCLQVAIDPGADSTGSYDGNDVEFGAALTSQGVQTHVWVDGKRRDWSGPRCEIHRSEGKTTYEMGIPLVLLGEAPGAGPRTLGLNMLAADADGGERLGWVDWTPGIGEEKLPLLFHKLTLAP